MKKMLGIMIALIMIGTSQASMNPNGNVYFGQPMNTVVQPKTVIQKGPVLVKKIPKFKFFSGKPQLALLLNADIWDDIIEVDDVITSYRREDLTKIIHQDGISDYVRWRLFLARQLALIAYKEKWS